MSLRRLLRPPLPAALAAAGVFLLAWASPIDTPESDPGVALLAAQALVEHGTLRLEVYRDRRELVYDLASDYRLRHYRGGSYYYSLGVPVVAAPAVWVARRLGYDMLRQSDEAALQNLLSALLTATVFLLLYTVCGRLVSPPAALALALLSTLGSPLVSTFATGLWSQAVALPLLLLALLWVVDDSAGRRPLRPLPIVLLLAAAYLCRPTAAFFALGLAAYLAATRPLPRRWWLLAGLGTVLAVAVLIWARDSLPEYYSPARLNLQTPLFEGLYGGLLSPSRGLLVFCPFLLPVLAASFLHRRFLVRQPLFWLAAVWGLSQLLAVSVKGKWWGGQCYGPRLLAALVPAAALVAALLWRGPLTAGPAGQRRAAALSFLALALPAVLLHSGVGLFREAPRRWNERPDIDATYMRLFSWREPQFLATAASIEERWLERQLAQLTPYRPGTTVLPASDLALFTGWYEPEAEWRWSRGSSAALHLRPRAVDPALPYLLALTCGARGVQPVEVGLDGRRIARWILAGGAPRTRYVLLAPGRLRGDRHATLTFDLPWAAPVGDDRRLLGLSFYALVLRPLPFPTEGLGFAADPYFLEGFSAAEAGWRWTAGRRARVAYPLLPPRRTAGRLRLLAGALGRQRVEVWLGGRLLGRATFEGLEPREAVFPVPAPAWPGDGAAVLELHLPDARRAAGDERLLGLAFRRLVLTTLEHRSAGAPQPPVAAPSSTQGTGR